MTSGLWRIAQWKRIPIYVHWSVLIGLVLAYIKTGQWFSALLMFASFFALLAVHELGHAVAARRRRTFVYEIRLYLMHGLCRFAFPYHEIDHIVIAWGGVLAQGVVLLISAIVGALLWRFAPEAAIALWPVFYVLIGANMVMIAFNLLPIAPLDGHIAWRILRPLGRGIAARWRNAAAAIRRALFVRRRRREMKRDAENKVVDLMERMRKK